LPKKPKPPSAALQLNFGIDGLELAAGVIDFHLPIDAALRFVDVARPGTILKTGPDPNGTVVVEDKRGLSLG
jgi:hypothetical protein